MKISTMSLHLRVAHFGMSAAFFCALAGPGFAQGLVIGNGLSLDAGLGLRGMTADNYFYSRANQQSAQGYSLRPSVQASYAQGPTTVRLTSDLDYSQWDVPGKLGDVFEYGAGIDAAFNPFLRHRFSANAGYRRGHDDAGAARTEAQANVLSNTLDQWQDLKAGLGYRFGNDNARANSQFSAAVSDRRYLTNRASTGLLDYQTDQLGYTLFYNYSPKTSWVIGINRAETHFDLTPAGVLSRDSVEYHLRTGLVWKATAKTSGDVRVGYYSHEPKDRSNSIGGLDWQAQVHWQPLSGTGLTLNTGRASTASYRTDTRFNNERSGGVTWQQQWTSRLDSRTSYTYQSSQFIGSGIRDATQDAGLELGYAPLPRVSLSLAGHYLSRSSNQSERDYGGFRASAGINLKL